MLAYTLLIKLNPKIQVAKQLWRTKITSLENLPRQIRENTHTHKKITLHLWLKSADKYPSSINATAQHLQEEVILNCSFMIKRKELPDKLTNTKDNKNYPRKS